MRSFIFRKLARILKKTLYAVCLGLGFLLIFGVYTMRSSASLNENLRFNSLSKNKHKDDSLIQEAFTAPGVIKVVYDAEKSREYLFEKLNKLNFSPLEKCGKKSKRVALVDDLLDMDKSHGDKHVYKVYVPQWQENIQKLTQPDQKHFLSAVLRVRLYKEDKARWTLPELKQWMHYQFLAGTEHIYLCNHFLHESEILTEPLKRYIELGLVTYLPWDHILAVPGTFL